MQSFLSAAKTLCQALSCGLVAAAAGKYTISSHRTPRVLLMLP